jgi:hypothetical protein
MSAFAGQVEQVIVRIKDFNGPEGGHNKECSVEVVILNFALIVVRKRSSDSYVSIRKALGRAFRTTLRKLGRRRTMATSHRRITMQNHLTHWKSLVLAYLEQQADQSVAA